MNKLLLLSITLGISVNTYADTVLPEFAGGIKPDAITSKQLTEEEMNACMDPAKTGDYESCILAVMKKHNASAQAIAFNKYTNGWINDFKTYGKLTVIVASIQAADFNTGYFIINDQGAVIDVYDYAILDQIDINKNPHYKEITQRFPNVRLYPPLHTSFSYVTTSPENTPRVVFTYSLVNGCSACEIVGTAKIGFDFDNDGKFINAKLIDLIPTQNNNSVHAAATSNKHR